MDNEKKILLQVEEKDGSMRLVLNEMTEIQSRALSNLIKKLSISIDNQNEITLEEIKKWTKRK